MIRTPDIEDRRKFGEITQKVLLSVVSFDQNPLSFPDKNGSVALAFREDALQFTSVYSEKLRSDYILPFDQIESILLHGTPRIERKTKFNKFRSMLFGTLILGVLGLLVDHNHAVLPMIMATLGLILGALMPFKSSETELFWQISIQYKMDHRTYTLHLEGKDYELQSLCAALKDHALRNRVKDELNMIDVLRLDSRFGL